MADERSPSRVLLGIASVAIIVGAVAYMVFHKPPAPKGERPVGTTIWQCEACGARFARPGLASPRPCEKCGKTAAVRLVYYYCKHCRAAFEAYLSKFPDQLADKLRQTEKEPLLMDLHTDELLRRCDKGADWLSASSAEGQELLRSLACPRCGSAEPAKVLPASGKQSLEAFEKAHPPAEGRTR